MPSSRFSHNNHSEIFSFSKIETFYGMVESSADALRIFQLCRQGKLGRVRRRLYDSERKQIRSGSVFVFNEAESGIKRWTDGRLWSPSRIFGDFLIYRELERKYARRTSIIADRNSSDQFTNSLLHPADSEVFDSFKYQIKSWKQPDSLFDTFKTSASMAEPTLVTTYQLISSASTEKADQEAATQQMHTTIQPIHGPCSIQEIRSEILETKFKSSFFSPSSSIAKSLSSQVNGPDMLTPMDGKPTEAPKSLFIIRDDGLIKKTLSMTIDGQLHHLICYYSKRDFFLGRASTYLPLVPEDVETVSDDRGQENQNMSHRAYPMGNSLSSNGDNERIVPHIFSKSSIVSNVVSSADNPLLISTGSNVPLGPPIPQLIPTSSLGTFASELCFPFPTAPFQVAAPMIPPSTLSHSSSKKSNPKRSRRHSSGAVLPEYPRRILPSVDSKGEPRMSDFVRGSGRSNSFSGVNMVPPITEWPMYPTVWFNDQAQSGQNFPIHHQNLINGQQMTTDWNGGQVPCWQKDVNTLWDSNFTLQLDPNSDSYFPSDEILNEKISVPDVEEVIFGTGNDILTTSPARQRPSDL